ncbi:RmlC-like cupin domain-containing protein [Ampelomyces quisqualis]|uniref:RmlC-like cupin domain-containing protein n=1 Tax=Ampelomyces quisqualis TaxID=50730 RepID=A0A6A5QE68_AMPQU|nr:RmlC-like cupin domain-containing protein [Ampelomyces quisqualis]
MPGEVQVKKSSEIKAPDGPQTDGMIRMPAIVDNSDQICGTVMLAKPRSSSAVHHHGEEDTIVYAASGHGAIVSGPDGSKRQELAPGDFALIPAYAEHQEVNDSDKDVVWIITRGGRNPIVHNLEGWSKAHEILPKKGAF